MDTKKRIFTIACRKGTAIITDSKPEANGKGSLKKYEAANSQLACLKALNGLLKRMPVGVKLDYSVAILLPENVNFLAYEDNRKYWLANKAKKSGEALTPELLAEVEELHKLLKIQGKNIQMFNQKRLTSLLYKSYYRATWAALENIVPLEKQDVVSCNGF